MGPPEVSAPAPRASSRPAILVFGVIVLFVGGIAGLAWLLLYPRGDAIGALDLRGEEPSAAVDLEPGDRLSFRLDVTVGTVAGYPNSWRSRSNAVLAELESSTLTVTLVEPSGEQSSATCGAYAGRATTVSNGDNEVGASGLPLRCSLVAQSGGNHVLSARVSWAPKDVRRATLGIQRERKDR